MPPESSGGPRPRRVVLAPDKFKGSLTAAEVAEAVAAGIRRTRPDVRTSELPVADGGDGSVAAALASGHEPATVAAAGPLGEPSEATIAVSGNSAVIELASICGLHELPAGRLEPVRSTTVGLGLGMRAALEADRTSLVVGLGGSASTDGGAGMLVGLGARILDADGRDVPPTPADLDRAARVDLGGLDPRVRDAEIVFAVDVRAPLLGAGGAAAVFGPQKGADGVLVRRLEEILRRWADLLRTAAPQADPDVPGAGAAGGVGFAGTALGATLASGAETFLDLAGFDRAAAGADLVVTGEGRLDEQTLLGKAPAVVAERCRRAGVRCVAVVGSRADGLTDEDLRRHGFAAVLPLVEGPASMMDPAASRAALSDLGSRIAREFLRPA